MEGLISGRTSDHPSASSGLTFISVYKTLSHSHWVGSGLSLPRLGVNAVQYHRDLSPTLLQYRQARRRGWAQTGSH